ncbi:tetratricopeptide repeat protein [Thermobifida alba]|uniref:Tetratricopeptide repeat protein n=1 Tax=Thermobifida alba TaxID=53522 RepID=A0ABY4L2M2_THEAE|nr:tetratricopeptide repeat protein [Thermobifida alba]UPT20568.1 tetratricopeptide repeat protein [Thermobifida alba]
MKILLALTATLLWGGGVAVMVWVAGGWSWQAAERAGWLAAIAALLLPATGLWVWALRPGAQAAEPPTQPGPGPSSATNTVRGDVSGQAVQAHTIESLTIQSVPPAQQRDPTWWSAPVAAVDPLEVGVHRSREGLPSYVARDCETQLAQHLDQAVERGGLVLVVGPSTAGKTRAAWTAVATRCPDREVFVPDPGTDLTRLADAVGAHARTGRRAVVWLDDLDKHLNEGSRLTGSLLNQFHHAGAVVVATMRQGIHTRLTAPGPAVRTPEESELKVGEEERRLLRDVDAVEVARQWSGAELDRAQNSGDTAVVEAACRQRAGHGHGVGEYLSSAPQLLALWQAQRDLSTSEGGHPRAFRVVAASVDLARIGVEHADRDLLQAAHELYDLSAVLRPKSFDQALDWATRTHEDTCGLLLPATTDDPPTEWRPFDYLVDQITTPIPDALWHLALEHATNPHTHTAIGRAAHDHDRPAIAETAFRRAADAEHPHAMNGLGVLLHERGEVEEAESWYRRAAEANVSIAMRNLGLLLDARGESAEAESWYRRAAEANIPAAMSNLGLLLAERGEVEEAESWYRHAIKAGHPIAMVNLGFLLEKRGKKEEAEQWYRHAIKAGHPIAMRNLGFLLEERGEREEAEVWYRRAIDTASNANTKCNLGVLLEERRREAEQWRRVVEEAAEED